MTERIPEQINYFTSKNIYFSGAVDLTVVREEFRPTGLIIPSGIAMFELQNQSEHETALPRGWVWPTEEEAERILASRQYKDDIKADENEPEEGEHYLEVVGSIDALHDALVGFVSQAIQAQNQVIISLNTSIRADEKECMQSIGDAVRRMHNDTGAGEIEAYTEPSDGGYGLYL